MNDIFSKNIKELRTYSKLTQSEFAEKINVTQAALSAYEKGTRFPTAETLVTIANIFNVSLDWLCGLSDRMHSDYLSYSDVFDELIKICSIKYPIESKMEHSHLLHITSSRSDKTSLSFYVNDVNVRNFFDAWVKMRKNYVNKLIDKDIYDIWLEHELKKYNFAITGLPESCS